MIIGIVGQRLLCNHICLLFGIPGTCGRETRGHNHDDEDGEASENDIFVLLHHWETVIESFGASNTNDIVHSAAAAAVILIMISIAIVAPAAAVMNVTGMILRGRQVNILKAGNVRNFVRCFESI